MGSNAFNFWAWTAAEKRRREQQQRFLRERTERFKNKISSMVANATEVSKTIRSNTDKIVATQKSIRANYPVPSKAPAKSRAHLSVVK